MDKGKDFYSRPCGRGDTLRCASCPHGSTFLLTPLREGRPAALPGGGRRHKISTHAPAGGATSLMSLFQSRSRFLLTPLREGRLKPCPRRSRHLHFYSRPCGRGDRAARFIRSGHGIISTHAPAGGATKPGSAMPFLFRNFYSRPCGRGDTTIWMSPKR